nr:MAG TPA: hypothetical protein [Caudoviricetes sp.]
MFISVFLLHTIIFFFSYYSCLWLLFFMIYCFLIL